MKLISWDITTEIIISQRYISVNNRNVESFAIWSSKDKEDDIKTNKHSAHWANMGLWKNCKWDSEKGSLQPDAEACAQ